MWPPAVRLSALNRDHSKGIVLNSKTVLFETFSRDEALLTKQHCVPLYDGSGFQGDAVLVYEPTYQGYEAAERLVSAIKQNKLYRAELIQEDDVLPTPKRYIDKVQKTLKQVRFEVTFVLPYMLVDNCRCCRLCHTMKTLPNQEPMPSSVCET